MNSRKILQESPQIMLNQDNLFNPHEVNFKRIISDATAEEENQKRLEAENKLKRQYRSQYEAFYYEFVQKLNTLGSGNVNDILEFLFNKLVPGSGACETVAGEYVRATMRLLYRWYNDGDMFFSSYGIETCGSSAEYLWDNCSSVQKIINKILDQPYKYDSDSDYEAALTDIVTAVLIELKNNEDLFYTQNRADSRDYPSDYIQENQPRYEFEMDGSSEVAELVERDILTAWDLNEYVENQLEWYGDLRDAEVDRPWSHHSTSVTVSNLTKDGYEFLRNLYGDGSHFWDDLVSEHADELDMSEPEEYDDDFGESMMFEDILNEANPLNKLKKRLNKSEKRYGIDSKSLDKLLKNAAKIISGDFDKKLVHGRFYYQNPTNHKLVGPLSQEQWLKKFKDDLRTIISGNLQDPRYLLQGDLRALWDAVVTDSTGNIVRRGLENMKKSGLKINPANPSTYTPHEKYSAEGALSSVAIFDAPEDEDDIDDLDSTTTTAEDPNDVAEDPSDVVEEPKTTDKEDTKTEDETTSDTTGEEESSSDESPENTDETTSTDVTQDKLDKIRSLAKATGMLIMYNGYPLKDGKKLTPDMLGSVAIATQGKNQPKQSFKDWYANFEKTNIKL